MVGARSFALYLLDDDRNILVPVISQGVDPNNLATLKLGEGLIGKACATSQSHWVESDPSYGTVENPSACIPLVLGDRSVGVVVVHSTFEQKNSFVELDFELFKLIAAHAASAIAAARLFALHGSRIGPLDAFQDLD
jgi:signal transduction protein with GAF and PtsI domain